MTKGTQEALEALAELYEEELSDYLVDMVLLAPETFLSLVHANHMLMLEELRDEKHNGYSMYPELQL